MVFYSYLYLFHYHYIGCNSPLTHFFNYCLHYMNFEVLLTLLAWSLDLVFLMMIDSDWEKIELYALPLLKHGNKPSAVI